MHGDMSNGAARWGLHERLGSGRWEERWWVCRGWEVEEVGPNEA